MSDLVGLHLLTGLHDLFGFLNIVRVVVEAEGNLGITELYVLEKSNKIAPTLADGVHEIFLYS